ncbi:hypothetical protein [Microbulbifer sp.]|uniref:hypothetical protein n=1 Tax=Microbulbifer sp. TaxID=1908541 RepID=UPI003F3E2F66
MNRVEKVDQLTLESEIRERHVQRNRKKDFVLAARLITKTGGDAKALRSAIRERTGHGFHHSDGLRNITERAVAQTLSDAWGSEGGRELAQAYLGEIAHRDGLSILAMFARTIPLTLNRALVATGAVAGPVGEDLPKAVRDLTLNDLGVDPLKVVSLVVLSEELIDSNDGAAQTLFERELENAVIGGGNNEIPRAFINFGTTAAPAGADMRGTLQNMLEAAEPSAGYILFAPAGTVQGLAADAFATNMTPRGGEFAPGIFVLPWEPDSSDSDLALVPASKCAFKDYGLAIESARHATVDMSDTPQSPSEQVSLWQTNSVGVVVERRFAIVPSAPAVTADLPA